MITVFEKLEEKLKEMGIEEEKAKSIVEFEKSNVPKEFIPSDKHKEKLQESENKITELKEQLDQTSSSLENLQSNDNSEELKQELEKIKEEHEKFKSEVGLREERRNKINYIKSELVNDGFNKKGVDLIVNTLKQEEIDEMQYKDDKIVGIEELKTNIETEYDFLKEKEKIESSSTEKGKKVKSDDDMEDFRRVMGLK